MYIIPKPQELSVYNEKIKIETLKLVADAEIRSFFKLDISDDGNTEIIFLNDEILEKEQYKINISSEKITVKYGTYEGAFRAYTTLKQIFSQSDDGFVNCLEIYDYPNIDNRGYMLDISRGKLPKLEYLKKLCDILANLKYNQLQLYMESFVYEYKNFPEYCKDTEPLTGDEIKELDKYCKKLFIKLVPNQNSFGHMAAWTEKKELSHLAITKDGKTSATLNPLLEGSLELIDKIYDGIFDDFSADVLNIGMDEPFELGLNETKEVCDIEGTGKVYTDYLVKVCKLAYEKYRVVPMFWDDIVFKHPEQLDNIPDYAIVMEWGYETEQHFDRNCRRLQERNLRYYVCPGSSTWGSFTGRTNNAILNIGMAAEAGVYYGAEGFLLTEWGDGGHPQFPSVTYFPLVYGGAVSWNCGDHNHEVSHNERRIIVDDCKKYVDKYIFDIKGNISLCDIVYRMGNYYLMEDMLLFNRTELWYYFSSQNEITPKKLEGLKRVNSYMKSLRKELDDVTADEESKCEIKFNCDLVIFISDYLCGERNKTEFKRLKNEFCRLWKKDNHEYGVNVFLDAFEKNCEF